MRYYWHLPDNQKFQISLIVLFAYLIIKSGSAEQRKIDAFLALFEKMEPDDRVLETAQQALTMALSSDIDPQSACDWLKRETTYPERLVLLRAIYCFISEMLRSHNHQRVLMEEIGERLGIHSFEREKIRSEFVKDIPVYYYWRLGLKPGATAVDVKGAYRHLALQYHPDRLQHHNQAYVNMCTAKLMRINEAYSELQKVLC